MDIQVGQARPLQRSDSKRARNILLSTTSETVIAKTSRKQSDLSLPEAVTVGRLGLKLTGSGVEDGSTPAQTLVHVTTTPLIVAVTIAPT